MNHRFVFAKRWSWNFSGTILMKQITLTALEQWSKLPTHLWSAVACQVKNQGNHYLSSQHPGVFGDFFSPIIHLVMKKLFFRIMHVTTEQWALKLFIRNSISTCPANSFQSNWKFMVEKNGQWQGSVLQSWSVNYYSVKLKENFVFHPWNPCLIQTQGGATYTIFWLFDDGIFFHLTERIYPFLFTWLIWLRYDPQTRT